MVPPKRLLLRTMRRNECQVVLLSPDVVTQAELASTVTELKKTREEVQALRSQLSAAVEESAQMKKELATLSQEAADMESRLNAEVSVSALHLKNAQHCWMSKGASAYTIGCISNACTATV